MQFTFQVSILYKFLKTDFPFILQKKLYEFFRRLHPGQYASVCVPSVCLYQVWLLVKTNLLIE